MKLFIFLLFTLLICTSHMYAIAIQQPPQPTRTALSINQQQETSLPTPAPLANHFIKRDDLEDTLSLYEVWASDCTNDNTEANIAVVSGLNNLWQVVTSTVYCGNGYVTTITKTITATMATTTTTVISGGSGSSSGSSTPLCDAKCWSTYLWHTYGYGISVAQAFTGLVCMLFGVYYLVFGYSAFRATLAAVGFVFFAVMTWIGLVNNEPQYGYPHNEVVYICVSAGLGLIGAFLFVFIYSIALYFIGALAGFFCAVFILSWRENLVIQIAVARICFIVGMGVVFAILIILAESYVVIFCTSFIGAYLFILGLDLFIHTGLINVFLTIFDGNKYHTNVYILQTPTYVMLAFVIVLTLASFGWQYYWNVISRNRQFGVNIEEAASDEKK